MAEPSIATPGSTGDSGTPAKTPAAKDRRCDFCGQYFTSSSLGRHLDLYVKEKNPKPPDGIHNVDEIRRMRGNITRRQARNSSAKRETSTPTASKPSPLTGPRSPSRGRGHGDGAHTGGVGTRLNAASWHATGVINDLPPTPRQNAAQMDLRRDNSRRASVKNEFARRQNIVDDAETGRAVDLALREVLGSLRAASARSQPAPTPFDFDPFSLTYPALCLRCLHPPPTLFSGQPFSTTSSWSIEAPGPAQLEPLRQYFQETYRRWRSEKAVAEGRKDPRNLVNGHSNGYTYSDQQAQQEQDKVMKHLTSAFNHWKVVPEKQRQESWRLEVLRAYAHEQEKQKATAVSLESAEQEVLRLRAQVDQLSKCQQPREFLLFPPTAIPIPQDAIKEMSKTGLDLAALDYDTLVDKWKGVIHRHHRSNTGMAAQKPLPDAITTPSSSHRTRNFATPQHDAGLGSGMVNGHSALRGPGTNGDGNANANTSNVDVDNLDEDLADADAEGDEPDHHAPQSRPRPGNGAGGRAPQAVMDRGVPLDPSLQGHGGHGHAHGGHEHAHGHGQDGHADGMVLDGIEGNGVGVGGMDAEGFIHGQMLMGLSADLPSPPLASKQTKTPRFAQCSPIYTFSLEAPLPVSALPSPVPDFLRGNHAALHCSPLRSAAVCSTPLRRSLLVSALLVIDGGPPVEKRDLVLDGVDAVADDGEDDEEDDDDDCDDEVAGDHFRGGCVS